MRVTVSARVQDGWTALMFASKHGLEAAAKLLVAKGVAKDAKNTVGDCVSFASCAPRVHARFCDPVVAVLNMVRTIGSRFFPLTLHFVGA